MTPLSRFSGAVLQKYFCSMHGKCQDERGYYVGIGFVTCLAAFWQGYEIMLFCMSGKKSKK